MRKTLIDAVFSLALLGMAVYCIITKQKDDAIIFLIFFLIQEVNELKRKQK